MQNQTPYQIVGLPQRIPAAAQAVFRSRVLQALEAIREHLDPAQSLISIGTPQAVQSIQQLVATRDGRDTRNKDAAPAFSARTPDYTFEQLILPEDVMTELTSAIVLWNVEPLVFDQWGLRRIQPYPRVALNFYGPPGTGKTLAAHALAHRLQKKIMVMSYAQIESKYHGDGPKNVEAVFAEAEKQDAVLFMDEADSLLSQRLTNVNSGSEQAINSMRSQLLICLEQFQGVVIFATNLVQNYDKAFETRVRHIEFPMPNQEARTAIWRAHLPETLPLAPDVNIEALSEQIDDICGRDIRNAVVDAAVRTAIAKAEHVTQQTLIDAIERIKAARIDKQDAPTATLSPTTKTRLEERLRAHLNASAVTPSTHAAPAE